jgi:hypothetical protein
VTLTAKHRSTLYTKLAPIVGDEEAIEALLAQFPAREADEPITRDFLRAELESLRSELKADIAELRSELHQELRAFGRSMVTWLIGVGAVGVTVVGILVAITA